MVSGGLVPLVGFCLLFVVVDIVIIGSGLSEVLFLRVFLSELGSLERSFLFEVLSLAIGREGAKGVLGLGSGRDLRDISVFEYKRNHNKTE